MGVLGGYHKAVLPHAGPHRLPQSFGVIEIKQLRVLVDFQIDLFSTSALRRGIGVVGGLIGISMVILICRYSFETEN